MFKFLIAVLFTLAATNGAAQQTIQSKKHNVGSTHNYSGGDLDTCIGREFSLVFYGIQNEANQRTPLLYQMYTDSMVHHLNLAFQRLCIRFRSCSTLLIPNFNFNEWDYPKTDQMAVNGWYTKNVINVYLPDLVMNAPSYCKPAFAYNYGVWGAAQKTLDVIVVSTGATFTTSVGSNQSGVKYSEAIHAFGHYFGLPDTYAALGPAASPPPPNAIILSHEYANGTNSSTNGDLFTDTPADCYPYDKLLPNQPTMHCEHTESATDGNGDYYTPPVDNFMSQWACRCRFSQQQLNHMARFIMSNRMNLH